MRKIVIIGANVYQDPLIHKAKEMGFETHVFAWKTGDAGEYSADYFYPISIINHDSIYKECKRIKPEAIVSVASDIAVRTIGHISAKLGLLCNSEKSIMLTTNKIKMRYALRDEGLVQPSFFEAGDSFNEEAASQMSFPLIVKPSDRSGARGVCAVDSRNGLMRAITAARDLAFDRCAIVEEYIGGDEYSCECISFGSVHHLLAITKVELAEGSFIGYEYTQPATISAKLFQSISDVVKRALDAMDIKSGASHVELRVAEGGAIVILEVNACMSGYFIGSELTPVSTGYDYLRMVIDTACGIPPDFTRNSRPIQAKLCFLHDEDSVKRFRALQADLSNSAYRIHKCREFSFEAGTPSGFYILSDTPLEMGSYLPLELGRHKEFHRHVHNQHIRRVNTYRTAIRYALQSMGARKVFVPHLYYPSTLKLLRELGYQIVPYKIDKAFIPQGIEPEDAEAVILVNYYGIMGEAVEAIAKKYRNVVIDNSFAFFRLPVMRDGVYNVYSCRRFFGVPDGAYLIGRPLADIPIERDFSHTRADYLIKCIELGTNAAYQDYIRSEQRIGDEMREMSALTFSILDSIDYDYARRERLGNFYILHRELAQWQQLEFSIGDDVPQCYPLLCEESIRDQLVDMRIYVPNLWRKAGEHDFGEYESIYASKICCLPIDHRYGKKEMEYLAGTVSRLLRTTN